MSKDIIGVSIICNIYNHGKYLKQAFDGFVMQKTEFAYEVLIHDDASTDDSARIIKEYTDRYPDLFKSIIQKENQYTKGVPITKTFQIPRVRGKYIAFCEGDDYWIDPYKLQKQYDALEANPDVYVCAHAAYKVQDGKRTGLIAPKNTDCFISFEEVISGGGGLVSTNSLMISMNCHMFSSPMSDVISYDYTIQIESALHGGMIYLKDCMSAYRILSLNSWSSRMMKDKASHLNHLDRAIKMLRALDNYTNNKYHNTIEEKIADYRITQFEIAKDYKSIISKPYRVVFRKRTLRHRIKIYCLYVFKRLGFESKN